MKKVQLLNDYLLATGLLPTESLSVWTTEGSLYGANDAGFEQQGIELKYQVNISIDNFPFDKQDIRKVLFALKWWLDVYEPDVPYDAERLKLAMDIETSTTAYVWIGLELSENAWMEGQNTEIKGCFAALIPDDEQLSEMPADFITYLKNQRTGERTVINDPTGDDGSVPTN